VKPRQSNRLDQQQLANNLMRVGAERLALIGKHAEALMQGYLQGEIDETQFSPQALSKLASARILYQPDESKGLMLRPLVMELIASMVTDENRRHINADVADKLEQIEHRVHSYKEAQRLGDYVKAEFAMQLVAEQVHDLTGQFDEAIHSLWHRLNTNFGFVASLSDKIRENQRAQNQIHRLLDGLSLIQFDELIALGDGSPTLRRLLVSQLQAHMSVHHRSLLEVQKRLLALMGRFREQQARSLLITNMASYLRQQPQLQVGDYAWRTQVPEIINQAAALSSAAAVSLDETVHHDLYAEMVRDLGAQLAKRELKLPDSASAGASELVADAYVETKHQALKEDAERLFLAAVDAPEPVSALTYLQTQALDWDAEIWLFQILAEHQGLPRSERELFGLSRVEVQANAFNHTQVIEDIHIHFEPQT